ncbi:MAG TPA: polysaccharide biosynthesis/export family protein [Chthoniobacterales bacterium]|jgi:polysaccharide export outer membrane protein|nr:polysaccharide biosynthesis/export family protein [Chthoniobacterales bacterium]
MQRSQNPRTGTNAGYEPFPALVANQKNKRFSAGFYGIAGKLAFLAFLAFVGCQQTTPHRAPVVAQTPNYLNPGDVIKVTFPSAPELNQTQPVGTDGSVSLPLVGEVHAAGKSPAQLQTELANLYKSQLQNNEVIVTLETRSLPVVVSGAVQKPGKVVFERPATVLEAIMEAGGFTPEADLKRVSVIRIAKGEHYAETYDFRPVLRGKPTPAVYVASGDVIYVPERLLNF